MKRTIYSCNLCGMEGMSTDFFGIEMTPNGVDNWQLVHPGTPTDAHICKDCVKSVQKGFTRDPAEQEAGVPA